MNLNGKSGRRVIDTDQCDMVVDIGRVLHHRSLDEGNKTVTTELSRRFCSACKKQEVAVTGDVCGLCKMKLHNSRLDHDRWVNAISWFIASIICASAFYFFMVWK